MPGLYLYGRRWAIASDDLPALAFFGVLFHGAWLLLIVIFSIYAHSVDRPEKCDGAVELAAFMASLLLSLLVSTICDILIIWYGTKGTIFQPSLRRSVSFVMYILTFNFLLKICITSYGTYLVFIQQSECLQVTDELNKVMQAVIISTWIIIFLYIVLSVISYQAFPKNSVLQWKRRIRFINWCCCGNFIQMESEPLARMALVFDKFFKPVNFSPTDTLIAMYLAAKHQTFSRNQNAVPTLTPLTSHYIVIPRDCNGLLANAWDRFSPSSSIEMRQKRLPPVLEHHELTIIEEGQSSEQTSSFHEAIDINIEEDINSLPQQEIIEEDYKPRHRRSNAFDFSQVDLEDHLPIPQDSEVHISSEDSSLVSSKQESADYMDSEEDASSVDTTLTWEDDFTGPYLIPSDEGSSNRLVSSRRSVDYETLERMYLYHRYALASYGALLYLVSGKRFLEQCQRFCGLCIRAATPSPSLIWNREKANQNGILSSNNSKNPSLINRLNEEAVLLYGFQQKHILYRSHEDVLAGHLPYFVALDEKDKSVVVAVRGTWSWADIVTDFLIQPEPLNDEECAQVYHLVDHLYGLNHGKIQHISHLSVHSGMLNSARGLLRNLENVGILEFLENGSFSKLCLGQENRIPVPDIHDWKFVMTGHSLGAGVVSLATLLLKSKYHQQKIECFAISPPACVMSAELAEAISPFCFSLVHGKDLVPRISVLTAERLRDQMVRAVTLSKTSKMRVLFSGLLKKDWTEEQLFLNPIELDKEPLNAMKAYKSAVRQAEESDDLAVARRFIPPGKIVFLRPKTTQHVTNKKTKKMRNFEAVWVSGKDLTQEGILLSLCMIKDHFPFFSIESLKEVIEQRKSYC